MNILAKELLLFAGGPFIGYLIANGHITQACQGDVLNAFSVAVGGLVTIGSLALGVRHSIVHAEIKADMPVTTLTATAPSQPITP